MTPIAALDVHAYRVPTDRPESDGTFAWTSTTLIIVELSAGERTGLGYAYGDASAASIVRDLYAATVHGRDAMDIPALTAALVQQSRNIGRAGVTSTAISAIDVALWDLKARLLDVPLVSLLGGYRTDVEIYGSGGFTSYPIDVLQRQLGDWAESGIRHVKMKIGREPQDDVSRVQAAREAVGADADIFVDANGAYDRKQALAFAERVAPLGVTWFEEPVSSDDLAGLRLIRDRAPVGIDIAAGEYGYDPFYFRRMLEAGAVDCLQADATRCGGITGFMEAAAICDAFAMPLSAHTAPSVHVAPCCAAPRVRHIEYFHDHVRIERLFFDGAPTPRGGRLAPDTSRPGHGLVLKRQDAAAYEVT